MTEEPGVSPDPSMSKQIIDQGLADEYPFNSQFFQAAGGAIHYVDEGTREASETLLLVHGNPTWSFAWRNLIKRFRADYRCVAVDHLGCGLSHKPEEAAYTLLGHIERLEALVYDLDLKNITLIAHDWGGAIGMGVAGRNPERFRRFVLMNTAAFRSRLMPHRIAACRIPILGTIGVRGLNLFSRLALRMAVENSHPLPQEVKKGYLLPYDNWENRVAVDRFVKDIPLSARHPSYGTLTEVEENLTQFQSHPMLLPWGMRDWCFSPKFLEQFQQRFPQAETVSFDQAGHYIFEDVPQELGDACEDFFNRTSGQ